MATTDKRDAIMSIAEQIKKSQAAQRDRAAESDTESLQTLIESLRKQRAENTVSSKMMKKFMDKVDKATNPTTYLRAVVPSFLKTLHENMNIYDKERTALKKMEKLTQEARQKELKQLTAAIDALVSGTKGLKDIKDRFGVNAARHAALVEEEMKMFKAAEDQFQKNMRSIEKRTSAISEDAKAQWAKNRGIQLVKIVDDEPGKKELDDIQNMLAAQIEADRDKYELERIEAKKKATDERRYKEKMLEATKSRYQKAKEKTTDGIGGFFKGMFSLMEGLFSGDFVKGLIKNLFVVGIVGALVTGISEYFTNPEFRAKVDGIVNDVNTKYIQPMWAGFKKKFDEVFDQFAPWLKDKLENNWGKILTTLALAFPGTTIRLIGFALKGLWKALTWAAAAIGGLAGLGGAGAEGADLPDSDRKKGGTKGGRKTPKGQGARTGGTIDKNGRKLPPRDPKTGRFMKMLDKSQKSGALKNVMGKLRGGGWKGLLGRLAGGSLASGIGLALMPSDLGRDEDVYYQSMVDNLPDDIEITDEEFAAGLEAAQGNGFAPIDKWLENILEKRGLVLNPLRGDTTQPLAITREEAIQKGYTVPEKKSTPSITAPNVSTFPGLNPAFANIGLPQNMGAPILMAPNNSTSNSTTIIPHRSAKDMESNFQFGRNYR